MLSIYCWYVPHRSLPAIPSETTNSFTFRISRFFVFPMSFSAKTFDPPTSPSRRIPRLSSHN